MATVVTSMTFWTTGSAALRVQVRNATSGAVLQARASTGIREDVAGSGIYCYSASLADAPAYEIIWDAGGAAFDPASATGEIYTPPGAGGGGGGTTTIVIEPVPALVPSAGASAAPGVFYIKRHDTFEPLIYQARLGAQPFNLTGSTIQFIMRERPDDVAGILVDKAAMIDPDIVDAAANGWMRYQWDAALPHGDTDYLGDRYAEFEVTLPDGRKHTFPTTSDLLHEYIVVRFVADLDDA